MSGASFKGNLEVLNLSDIFQSLAMNKHSGTLIVTDGKREKKIYFAEGEISLLSSSRRLKLGELLIATGKITEEDLDLALKLQKQNRKKLGEILVEEGFCDEDDIAKIVRSQIEEEIYDLFLWRKAEFEFIADFMPDELKKNSPNIMRLTLNTNALIMEALRRLDEWELIKQAVPSTKEIFVVTDKNKLDKVELPERLRSEIHNIDGKNNVESLAEKALISEFELCQLLAQCVQAKAIRSLKTDELVQKAEEAYALNEHVAAGQLYARLAELLPGEPKVLIPLADSLRRSGDDRMALTIYDDLSKRMEAAKDWEKLRRCYEAIVALDPSRSDLMRKLESLESRQKSKRKGGLGIPLFVVVLVLLGTAFVFKNQIMKAIGPNAEAIKAEHEKLARESLKLAKNYESEAKQARENKDWKLYREKCRAWWDKAHEIVTKFPETDSAKEVKHPLLVTTEPTGFDVYLDDFKQGTTTVEFPIVEVDYPFVPNQDKIQVEVKRKSKIQGQKDRSEKPSFDAKIFNEGSTPVMIVDAREVKFDAEAPVETEILFLDASGRKLAATSRAGHLHLWDADKGNSDQTRLPIGDLGDTLSAPVLLAPGRLALGTVDRGLTTVEVDSKKVVPDAFVVDGPVVGKPLVTKSGVVLATPSGVVYGFGLDGKQRWARETQAPILQQGAIAGDLAVFACEDELLYAFEIGSGNVKWTALLGGAPAGPPCASGDTVVALAADGALVAVSVQDGKARGERWKNEGKPVKTVAADDVRAIVVTEDGHVRALDPRAGWKAIWSEDFVRAPNVTPFAPQLTLSSDKIVVTLDESHLHGIDAKTGVLTWVGSIEGSGHVCSPISVLTLPDKSDVVVVGTSTCDVHLFRRPP